MNGRHEGPTRGGEEAKDNQGGECLASSPAWSAREPQQCASGTAASITIISIQRVVAIDSRVRKKKRNGKFGLVEKGFGKCSYDGVVKMKTE